MRHISMNHESTYHTKAQHTLLVTHWIIPVLFGLVINFTLFGMMPGLIRTVPDKPQFQENFHPIQVIRIKRPDTPVNTKQAKVQPKREIKEKKFVEKKISITNPVLQNKIYLPFELNSRLPTGPQTIAMPALEFISMRPPDITSSYGVHDIDEPLTPLSKIPPIYPMRAKRLSIEGSVSVKFLVNETGRVDTIEILDAKPSKIFDDSVMSCISKWRFKPGTIEGIPVKIWVETTIHFELERT